MPYPAAFLEFCQSFDFSFTSLRRNVLFILWSCDKPLKAYEILEQLLKTRQQAKPPTVYRVLDFFVSAGIVHKIESIQSYTLCYEPEKHHTSEILMACSACHQVLEVYDQTMHELLMRLSKSNHFHLGQDIIELKGFCEICAKSNEVTSL